MSEELATARAEIKDLNFNPQMGIGTEFSISPAATYSAALRLHHISNAGLKKDNRGVNSIVFVIGRFF